MITVHNGSARLPLSLSDKAWSIRHVWDGKDILSFEISPNHGMYSYIKEERLLSTEENTYVVKHIDEHADSCIVDAEICLDSWKNGLYREYRRTDVSAVDVISEIMPKGWSVETYGTIFTRHKTVEAGEGEPLRSVTPCDILYRAADIFGFCPRFNVLLKVVTLVDPEFFTNSGEFFTDELNVRSVGFVGSSEGFATRLYAYGAVDEETGEPLTFAPYNDGKEYLEDFSYSQKVVVAGWQDERYTDALSLLEAAKKRLAALASPVRSYEVDVRNLAGDMWLFKKVFLIDRRRKQRIEHQCVEFVEYPRRHDLDICVLSAVTPTVTSTKSVQAKIDEAYQQTLTATAKKIATAEATMKGVMDQAIDLATRKITGASGGHVVIKRTPDGEPEEVLIMDTDNVDTAQYVIRMNLAGIGFSKNGIAGPYDTAWTIDGTFDASTINVINLNAGSITSGVIDAGVIQVVNLNADNISSGTMRAGKIMSQNSYGDSYWDVNTGEIYLAYAEIPELLNIHMTTQSIKWVNPRRSYGNYTRIEDDGGIWNEYITQSGDKTDGYRAINLYQGQARFYESTQFVGSIKPFSGGYGMHGTSGGKVAWVENGNSALNVRSLIVSGSKSRSYDTPDYGKRLLYSYETPTPYFGDIGEGVIGEDGLCYVAIDDIFGETVSLTHYQVFLQSYGEGICYVKERDASYFVAAGPPGTRFGWELKAAQKDLDQLRLEEVLADAEIEDIDYAALYDDLVTEEEEKEA